MASPIEILEAERDRLSAEADRFAEEYREEIERGRRLTAEVVRYRSKVGEMSAAIDALRRVAEENECEGPE